jgi:hypothetical protein
MNLDRALQRTILEKLRERYPLAAPRFLNGLPEDDEAAWIANMVYLDSHGLIDSALSHSLSGEWSIGAPKITAAGLDFLEDDGGLSAILGTVTVKLHADTIRALLDAKVDEADLPVEEKGLIKSALKAMPAMAFQELTKQLVQMGLQHLTSVHGLRSLVGL